jgi:hypothetical protein
MEEELAGEREERMRATDLVVDGEVGEEAQSEESGGGVEMHCGRRWRSANAQRQISESEEAHSAPAKEEEGSALVLASAAQGSRLTPVLTCWYSPIPLTLAA